MTIADLIFKLFDLARLWVIVLPWEQCVRVRGGRHSKSLSPGIHLRIPIIDKFFVQPTTTRVSNLYGQTLTTKDRKIISCKLVVQYRVTSLLALCLSSADPEDLIISKVAQSCAEIVGRTRFDELTKESIEALFEVDMEGLAIEKIQITDLALGARTIRLLNDKMTEYTWSDRLELVEV